MKNKHVIGRAALSFAPRYMENSRLLVDLLCERYGVKSSDRLGVSCIVALALDAASSDNFCEKADFLLMQLEAS